MDILKRLNKNIEAAQNGPYVGVKEQRDSWQAAIEEIIYLRNTVDNLKAHIGDYENRNNNIVDTYGHWRGGKLKDFLPVLQKIALDDMDQWYWGYNVDCKYLSISIDTRSGGFTIARNDRDELVTHLDIEQQ